MCIDSTWSSSCVVVLVGLSLFLFLLRGVLVVCLLVLVCFLLIFFVFWVCADALGLYPIWKKVGILIWVLGVLGVVSFVSDASSVVGGVGLSARGFFNAVPWFLHVLSLSSLSAIFRRKFSMCL